MASATKKAEKQEVRERAGFIARIAGGAAARAASTSWCNGIIASTFVAINREELAVGAALLTYARKIDANLLVMGSFAHWFERELMLGSAKRDVYRACLEMPVLLPH